MKLKKGQVKIFTLFYYFAVFFPYIKVIPIETDTQPGALILAFLFIIWSVSIKKVGIPKVITPFIAVACFSLLVFLIGGTSALGLRILLGYVSLPIIALGSYLLIKKDMGINIVILKLIISIWVIVGIIQLTMSPYFGHSLISNMRTTGERGVNSLAVEPTYFGQMMYFLMFYVLIFFENKKDKTVYTLLCAFSIFFLAKSSMIVLILGVNISIFFLNTLLKKWGLKTFKYIAISSLAVIVGVLAIISLPNSSRLSRTMNEIFKDGLVDFFRNDASSNYRLSSIVLSFKGALENFLFPNGFTKWQNYEITQKSQSDFFYYGVADRIMSMYGAILYELGFIGAYLIYLINYWMVKFIRHFKLRYYQIPTLMYINLIFMTAVPISTPFVGFLLGTLIYYSQKNFNQEEIDRN